MITLLVPDMHCEKCVERISNALKEAGIEFEVNLAEKKVCVENSKVTAAIDALDDLGFSAEADQ